jgi:hypothetical protein
MDATQGQHMKPLPIMLLRFPGEFFATGRGGTRGGAKTGGARHPRRETRR